MFDRLSAYRPQARAQASATETSTDSAHASSGHEGVGGPDEEKDSSTIDLSWADPEAELTGRG